MRREDGREGAGRRRDSHDDTTETKSVRDALGSWQTAYGYVALLLSHPPNPPSVCCRFLPASKHHAGVSSSACLTLKGAAQLDHRSLITSDLSSTDAR